MFAHGSNVDADHRRTDIDADAATVANTNFRSHEAAGSRADVSAKPVSYNTTYRATFISTYRPAVRGAVASTFSGADIVKRELAEGPARRRVGLLPEGRAPVREGAEILSPDGRRIGTITSGGFGPTVEGPVAMGYVETPFAAEGTEVQTLLRGRPVAARVVKLPFVATRYYKG